ncbi:unnamed protein product, partial [marine sediment metagenome]
FTSWEDLQAYREEVDLEVGTPVRVIFEGISHGPFSTCTYFDSFLADWTVHVPAGFELVDVQCNDEGNGQIDAVVASSATGVGFFLALGAMALLAMIVIGAFYFILCKIQAMLPAIVTITKWVAVAVLGGSGLFLIATLIRRRRT